MWLGDVFAVWGSKAWRFEVTASGFWDLGLSGSVIA